MASLEIVKGTTPTYVFNITDSSGSGISLDDYSIGMGLIYDAETAMHHVYILPAVTQDGTPTTFYTDNPATEKFYRDNRYCKNLGGGKFSITMPYNVTIDSATQYQIFIFKYALDFGTRHYEKDSTGAEVRPATSEVRKYDTIVIDSGNIEFIDSYLPVIGGGRKSGHIILK